MNIPRIEPGPHDSPRHAALAVELERAAIDADSIAKRMEKALPPNEAAHASKVAAAAQALASAARAMNGGRNTDALRLFFGRDVDPLPIHQIRSTPP